jgi:uncharacterized membrane protein
MKARDHQRIVNEMAASVASREKLVADLAHENDYLRSLPAIPDGLRREMLDGLKASLGVSMSALIALGVDQDEGSIHWGAEYISAREFTNRLAMLIAKIEAIS